jgi:hypothetical protein
MEERLRSALAAGVFGLLLPAAWSPATLACDTPEALLERYTEQAKAADPVFEGFKEAKLRYIDPFSPHANPQRFSDYTHVEKFFKLNCTMVLKRECTAREKGDLIAWLLTVEGEALYPAGRATGPARAEE